MASLDIGRRSLAALTFSLAALGCHRSSAPAEASDGGSGGERAAEGSPTRAPTPTPWLEGAQRGAVVRMGGRRAVAVADAGETRVLSPGGAVLGRWPGSGAVDVVSAVDLRGDGAEEIVVGRNGGRGGAATAVLIDPARPDAPAVPLDLAASARPEVVAAFVRRGAGGERDLCLAAFDSSYFVTLTRQTLVNGVFHASPLARMRMANAFAVGDVGPAAGEEIVVGRMYGDSRDAMGDLQVFEGAFEGPGAPVGIPTTGGVRAVAIGDVEGNGKLSVIAASGWDRDYGHKARALVEILHLTGGAGAPRREAVFEWPQHSTFRRVLAADVDGDGRAEVIGVRGLEDAGPAVLLRRSGEGVMRAETLGEGRVWDVVVGALSGDGRRKEVLLLGEAPTIVEGSDGGRR